MQSLVEMDMFQRIALLLPKVEMVVTSSFNTRAIMVAHGLFMIDS
jgi:hypothetical protein